jgi:hypothetical protein
MLQDWSEPSLTEALSDPVIQALMAADAVDPAALNTLLREIALRVEARLPPARPAGIGALPVGARH